jgi:DNA-binding FadR family transcriptional regulator
MSILAHITPCQKSGASRAEEIARQIKGLIFDLESQPGTCLGTKESLRRRFDVSPGTMNEALRILEVCGIIGTRRGSKGGVFVVAAAAQMPFSEFTLGLTHNAAVIEQCQAVANQLEPLVFVEAAKSADVGAVAELQRLVQNMAAAVDQPTELFRLSWRLYRHIAKMGVNAVLTGIYTTLLTFLEQEIGQAVAPVPNYSNPQQLVATSSALIEAIASGDTQRAAAAAKRNQLREGRGLSDRSAHPPTLLPTMPLYPREQVRNVANSVNVH